MSSSAEGAISKEEQEYRDLLRQAIAEITTIFLREHQDEIVTRARERLEIMRATDAE